MELTEIIGHILGLVALIVIFFTYQMREKKLIIFAKTVSIILMCLQYLLIGAFSGFLLNVVCIGRNIAYYYKDKKLFSSPLVPVIFATAILGLSIFSWEGYYSIFMILALSINTLCLGYFDPQKLRISLLFTCTCAIIYDLFVGSITGIAFESIAIISAIVGIIRFTKDKTPKPKRIQK